MANKIITRKLIIFQKINTGYAIGMYIAGHTIDIDNPRGTFSDVVPLGSILENQYDEFIAFFKQSFHDIEVRD